MYIYFRAEGQTLKRVDSEKVASNSKGFLFAKFDVGVDWDGLALKAVFEQKNKSWSQVLVEGICLVPVEVLSPGRFTVALVGVDADTVTRATTERVSVEVLRGPALDSENATEPTPSVVEQIYSAANTARALATSANQIANSVRADADNGLFNGSPGADGVSFEIFSETSALNEYCNTTTATKVRFIWAGDEVGYSMLITLKKYGVYDGTIVDNGNSRNLGSITEVIVLSGSTDEVSVKKAVDEYLAENPIKGITEEQAEQLNKNTEDIADLQKNKAGKDEIPTALPASDVYDWAKQPDKPAYTAEEVGARPDTWLPTPKDIGAATEGTVTNNISVHNISENSHNDIRLLITELTTRLNALADSEDVDLDQLSELVAYIKSNRDLISEITTSKVSVSDIVDDLVTNVSNKPLSAAQGVALKTLIDALQTGKLDATALTDAIDTALAQAKESGEFDGEDGVSGVYVGSPEDAPDDAVVVVDPEGEVLTMDDIVNSVLESLLTVEGVDTVYYVSLTGSNENDGLTKDTALASIAKAVSLGAKKIAVEAGEYFISSGITISNLRDVHIFAYRDNESYPSDHSAPKRKKVKITGATYYADYSTNEDGIYQQASVTAGFDYANVFTNQSKSHIVTTKATGHSTYHANLMLIHEDISKDYYLLPVLSYEECVTIADSFYWDGSTLYFNTTSTDFTKIAVVRSEVGLTITNCDGVVLDDICVSMVKGNALVMTNCTGVELNSCEANASALYMGFNFTDVDGVLNNCYATKNGYDGFNFHGYGTTVMNDCTAENNYDDGCSHHDGCIGTINGGRFTGSGKVGIAPAYGANVNIYNVVCEGNSIGIGYLSTTNGHASMSGNINGCIFINNKVGLQVDALCSVIAVNSCYSENITDKSVRGKLLEYGTHTDNIGDGSDVPSDYIKVEYIEADGNQYIDTGVLAEIMSSEYTGGIRYEIIGMSAFAATGNNYLFGALDANKTCRSGNLSYNAGSLMFYCGSGQAILTGGNEAIKNTEFNITVQGTPLATANSSMTLTYGDVTKTPTATDTSVSEIPTDLSIYLFKVNGASGSFAGQLRSFEMTGIKSDGTEETIRNFIPCYRKADGVIGLYDVIGGQFYTNAGTGSFAKGSDV